jgi:hypothetical protein
MLGWVAMSSSTRWTYVHLVARADRLPVPLTDDAVAQWLWPRMQRRFPLAIAAVLMPTHTHILTPARCAEAARHRLAMLTGALSRSGGVRNAIRFEPIPPALLDDDPVKLARQTRYVALNPQRARLVDDPLDWTWSTHRDVVGAVARPWVTADRLAPALDRSPDGFAEWWHGYVGREDDADEDALWFPTAATPTLFAKHSLDDVARAVAASMRANVSDIQKRGPVRSLFLVVAPLAGWRDSAVLASYCGITPRAVQKSFHRMPPVAIDAALLCLGDARLRCDPRRTGRRGRHAA